LVWNRIADVCIVRIGVRLPGVIGGNLPTGHGPGTEYGKFHPLDGGLERGD